MVAGKIRQWKKLHHLCGWVRGGQYIFIMPDIDMVIVMTSSFYLEDLSYILDVINTYLLDSVFGSPTN